MKTNLPENLRRLQEERASWNSRGVQAADDDDDDDDLLR